MLAKLMPYPPLAWIDGNGNLSLWISIPVASMLALNWSCATTGLSRLALIFSLALHVLILAWLPDPLRQDHPPAQGAMQATLRFALPRLLPLPPTKLAAQARIPEARRLPPQPIAPTAKAGTGAAAPPEIIPMANTAPAPEPSSEFPSAARRDETAVAPTVTQPALEAGDSQALDDYGRSLFELLARHRQYPRLAALRGWEGEVRLRLKVAVKGELLAVQVVRSSGHELLDQHALRLVQGIALPALPDSFGNREIQIVVPIRYKLQKPT